MSSSEASGYKKYCDDRKHEETYQAYQARYQNTPRESDKVLCELVTGELERLKKLGQGTRTLADWGCSTGNLLRLLRVRHPELSLAGYDLMSSTIEACRTNPELSGIEFHDGDILTTSFHRQFDIVTMNAVVFAFGREELARVVSQAAAALRESGSIVLFDLFHAFEQEVELKEFSTAFPEGLMIHMRSTSTIERVLSEAGFGRIEFHPFYVPIDLELPPGDRSVKTYTVPTARGDRLSFRGCIHQPWCHMVATLGT